MRRCKFFLGVFSLELPEYLTCNQFIDSTNSDVCVGYKQIREAQYRSRKPSKYCTMNSRVLSRQQQIKSIFTAIGFFGRLDITVFAYGPSDAILSLIKLLNIRNVMRNQFIPNTYLLNTTCRIQRQTDTQELKKKSIFC